jgi:hypothetical protein
MTLPAIPSVPRHRLRLGTLLLLAAATLLAGCYAVPVYGPYGRTYAYYPYYPYYPSYYYYYPPATSPPPPPYR